MVKKYSFPKGFYWGASTSSHQVEGHNTNDWTEWEQSEKRLKHLTETGQIEKYGKHTFVSGKAANHHHLFRDDFQLAKKLGHNSTRFSLEWSRIESEEGRFSKKALDKYRDTITHLEETGIEPFVTLWHWTIPLWLRDKGGWSNPKVIAYFERYVEEVMKVMGDKVRFWITLNEPEIFTTQSYLTGVWPPQQKNPINYVRVFRHLIKAHVRVYPIIKQYNPEAQVGIAKNNIYFEAHTKHPINRLVKRAADWWWNEHFLNQINKWQDFVGLNYYFHNRTNFFMVRNENKRLSDLGWELHPEGIFHVLLDLQKYNKPVYITENGLADAEDKDRSWYIREILKNVHRAIEAGVDVRGYLHWSLLDNFEWHEGFKARFGLVEVDYETMERKPRKSALYYKEIALNNILEETVEEEK